MKTLRITHAYLVELDVCDFYLNVFQRLFPTGVEVTLEEVIRHSANFDWSWAVRNILDPALPSGQGARLAAEKVYADYCNEIDRAYVIYHNSCHQENYRLRTEAARKEYRNRTARIFAEAFLVQDGRELLRDETL